MDYYDEVYGPYQFTDTIVTELMKTAAMLRLRGVLQHGITGLIGLTSPVTRYDHSVGTMVLVQQIGGSLSEQIAALLHDVSHTAFSHVIDYVYDNHDGQSFHDEHKESFLMRSDIPMVLEKYGYAWRTFLDDSQFTILEQPAPRLCADRLDYLFRDSIDLALADVQEVRDAISTLRIIDGRIATNSVEMARWLAYTYVAADDASWANFREVGLYELTARAIRRALEIGAIDEADIWGTDLPLWNKLKEADDQQIQSYLKLVSADTRFVWDENRPTFHVSTKIRTIDPDVAIDGKLLPLSTLDQEFASYRNSYVQRKAGKWPMRVVVGS